MYELDTWSRDLNTEYALGGCLFQSVKLNKNFDTDKYKYSGYSVGFDLRSEFSLPEGSMGKNVIIFGADMSSSVQIHNKGKDILILGKGPTQGLDDTTFTAEPIMNKTGLNGYVYEFFVDDNIIDTSNIVNTYKCLMKKT